ncbi:hypothetical protein [Agrococcus beijingensis]|uniref:hypothetical protein n=1 Tax=Agrococcus beijingensis TaxID=3068634 RepID=UPI0027413A54|nr:hypothetical protein [Agrococcus sp. REN33]
MDALTRVWGAVAALGAALIALAVGAAATPWVAVPLLAAGVAQAVVGVIALQGRRWPSVAVLTPMLVPTVVWLAALLAVPETAAALPMAPLLAETVLALGAGALLLLRRPSDAEPKPLATVLGLLSAAAVVATVATTALAGTNAGAFAVPHGEHGLTVQEHSGH